MKRKTSKEVLAESFREIAEHKNIDKITVKDIAENCGYSSATFYRQFRDKYDLIAWDYAQDLKRIMSGMDGSRTQWENILIQVAKLLQVRKTYLANLFLHTSGLESFLVNMQEVNFQCLKAMVEEAAGKQSMDHLTEMYIRLYVLGTSQFICEWILGKCKATEEELAVVLEQTLPLPLYKYFQ